MTHEIDKIDSILSEEVISGFETICAELKEIVDHNDHRDYASREFQALAWLTVANGKLTPWEAEMVIEDFLAAMDERVDYPTL